MFVQASSICRGRRPLIMFYVRRYVIHSIRINDTRKNEGDDNGNWCLVVEVSKVRSDSSLVEKITRRLKQRSFWECGKKVLLLTVFVHRSVDSLNSINSVTAYLVFYF